MSERPAHETLLLWVAQGFGIGRIPFGPGTFGSLLGFAWFAVLLVPGKLWALVLGSIAGAGLAVWLCAIGERLLGRKDPGSVVMDEVAAIPLCLWGWAAVYFSTHDCLPGPGKFFSWNNWPLILCAFVAFRLFDILKPWPAGRSQRLPGGWGIVADDLLAAIYVNLVVLPGCWFGIL